MINLLHHKHKIFALFTILVLVFSAYTQRGRQSEDYQNSNSIQNTQTPEQEELHSPAPVSVSAESTPSITIAPNSAPPIATITESTPAPTASEVLKKEENAELVCTLSVSCETVLENLHLLNEEKQKIIPQNGIIFPETEVVFYEDESVFNVLLREMKKNKIHFEFSITPVYNTAYIEGIANLYEFDCGDLAGWMYKVNGQVPGYGCSQYILNPGDKIELIYSCDLGKDIN